MLPAERREMGEEMVGYMFGLAEGSDGALQVSRVP